MATPGRAKQAEVKPAGLLQKCSEPPTSGRALGSCSPLQAHLLTDPRQDPVRPPRQLPGLPLFSVLCESFEKPLSPCLPLLSLPLSSLSFNCASQHSSCLSKFLSPVSRVHLCLLSIPPLPLPSLNQMPFSTLSSFFSLLSPSLILSALPSLLGSLN